MLTDNFEFSSELSINKTKFLSLTELNNRFSEFEFWSQLLIKNIFNSGRKCGNVLIKEKRKKLGFPIIIVGEIGSGKSEIAKLIAQKLNCEIISTRHIVSELINSEDFGTKNRVEFQNKSLNFIQNENGCTKIAQKIYELYQSKSQLVIDGVRNIETFEVLKKLIPTSVLIYIDVPIDSSFEYFARRSKRKVSIHEFRNSRFHDVEKEVVLFKHRADIYLYNGSTFKSLLKKLNSWLDGKKKISN